MDIQEAARTAWGAALKAWEAALKAWEVDLKAWEVGLRLRQCMVCRLHPLLHQCTVVFNHLIAARVLMEWVVWALRSLAT